MLPAYRFAYMCNFLKKNLTKGVGASSHPLQRKLTADESALRGVVLQRQASGKSNILCSMSLKQHVFNKIGVPSFAVFLGLSLHTSCV